MPIKNFSAPSGYIQCNGEVENLNRFVSCYGKRFFVAAYRFVLNLLSGKIKATFVLCWNVVYCIH